MFFASARRSLIMSTDGGWTRHSGGLDKATSDWGYTQARRDGLHNSETVVDSYARSSTIMTLAVRDE